MAELETWYAARRRLGICVNCHEPAIPGQARCEQHEAERRKKYAEKRKNKLCNRCGEPTGGPSYCPKCSTTERAIYRKRQARGVCLECGDETVEGSAMCQKHRDLKLTYGRRANQRRRLEAIQAYGGACKCCGETAVEFLQIDHVHNDGHIHRRQICGKNQSGGPRFYVWLRKHEYPQDGRFQILCANCNYSKSRYHCCPHQRRDFYTAEDCARIEALGMTVPVQTEEGRARARNRLLARVARSR